MQWRTPPLGLVVPMGVSCVSPMQVEGLSSLLGPLWGFPAMLLNLLWGFVVVWLWGLEGQGTRPDYAMPSET